MQPGSRGEGEALATFQAGSLLHYVRSDTNETGLKYCKLRVTCGKLVLKYTD